MVNICGTTQFVCGLTMVTICMAFFNSLGIAMPKKSKPTKLVEIARTGNFIAVKEPAKGKDRLG